MIPSALGLVVCAAGLFLVYLGLHGEAGWLDLVPQQPLTRRLDLSASSGHAPVQ